MAFETLVQLPRRPIPDLVCLGYVGKAEDHSEPTITLHEAIRILRRRFPLARILHIELAREDGELIYEVELLRGQEPRQVLHLNAETGTIKMTRTMLPKAG